MCMWMEGSWEIFRGFHLQFNFYCVSSLICNTMRRVHSESAQKQRIALHKSNE